MSTSVPHVFKELMGDNYWQMVENNKILLKGWLMALGITMYELRYKSRHSLGDVIEKYHLESVILVESELLSDLVENGDDWLTYVEVFKDKEYDMRLAEPSLLNLSEWCVSRLQQI